jgi:hypothetical protein
MNKMIGWLFFSNQCILEQIELPTSCTESSIKLELQVASFSTSDPLGVITCRTRSLIVSLLETPFSSNTTLLPINNLCSLSSSNNILFIVFSQFYYVTCMKNISFHIHHLLTHICVGYHQQHYVLLIFHQKCR